MDKQKYLTTAIIFNLPKAGANEEKLVKKLRIRLYELINRRIHVPEYFDIKLAKDENNEELTFAVIEGLDPDLLAYLSTIITVFKLDKKNVLYFTSWQNLIDYTNNNEAQLSSLIRRRPELDYRHYLNHSKDELIDWFRNSNEIFVVRANQDILIYQLDHFTNNAILINDGTVFRPAKGSETMNTLSKKTFWSPYGTYLVTAHDKGIKMWGGKDFRNLTRMTHNNVKMGLFSKNEEFLLTWDGEEVDNSIIAHNTITGQKLKCFPYPQPGPLGTYRWPFGSWSPCSKYLAFPQDNSVAIYDTSTMEQLTFLDGNGNEINTIPYTNCVFSWHNVITQGKEPVLAVWVKSQTTTNPSRLIMLKIPSCKMILTKNLFARQGQFKITWHPLGDYCILLTEVSKKVTGKGKVYENQLYVIHLNRPRIPIDNYISSSDITGVFISPYKRRFCTIHSNNKAIFHSITDKNLVECGTINIHREINECHWSPLGTHFVLASCNINDSNGFIWFGECEDNEALNTYAVSIKHVDEKSKLSAIEWDPSGRFVTASTSYPVDYDLSYKYDQGCGYTIYSFLGKPIFSQKLDKLHKFQWRPHPEIILPESVIQEIAKKLPEYQKLYEKQDKEQKQAAQNKIKEANQKIKEEFIRKLKNASELLKTYPNYEEWQRREQIAIENTIMHETFEEHLSEAYVTISSIK